MHLFARWEQFPIWPTSAIKQSSRWFACFMKEAMTIDVNQCTDSLQLKFQRMFKLTSRISYTRIVSWHCEKGVSWSRHGSTTTFHMDDFERHSFALVYGTWKQKRCTKHDSFDQCLDVMNEYSSARRSVACSCKDMMWSSQTKQAPHYGATVGSRKPGCTLIRLYHWVSTLRVGQTWPSWELSATVCLSSCSRSMKKQKQRPSETSWSTWKVKCNNNTDALSRLLYSTTWLVINPSQLQSIMMPSTYCSYQHTPLRWTRKRRSGLYLRRCSQSTLLDCQSTSNEEQDSRVNSSLT